VFHWEIDQFLFQTEITENRKQNIFYQVNICHVKSIQIIGIGIKILFEAAL